MVMFCTVTVLVIQAAVVSRVGFYVNDDYWKAIEEYPVSVQNEIIGSLTRLYFTGEDQLDLLKSKNSRPIYLATRERILQARKKAGNRKKAECQNAMKDEGQKTSKSQDKSAPRVPDQNGTFAKKRERENISTYNSSKLDTPPNLEEGADAPWIEFAKQAIAKFTEITGRRYDIPSSEVILSLHRIFEANYTISEIELAIRYKYEEWKDDKRMSNYIRPQTLFGQQFEGYVAAAKAAKEVKKDDQSARFAGRI